MAESAVSFLLNNFSTWLQYERNLLGELGPEVEYIIIELRHMRAFLGAADSKEQDDAQLNEWMRQVRDIAYDIEDVLDKYKLKFANHGTNGFSARIKKKFCSIKSLKSRHQIASQIQTIKSRVENASRSYERYRDMYPFMDQGKACYDGRGDALLLEDADVVGIENPKKQLLQWLESIESGLKVISVVGMAGMGKTTLVKKVYDDKLVKDNFDHHVWITVSESYKVDDLLARMIKLLVAEVKQPMPQGWEYMNADEMREFIYRFLQDKTYVVVLDDVWRIDVWESVRYAFPRSTTNSQGCIIITTRFNSIGNATSSDAKSHIYNSTPLTYDDSKMLFYKKAFPKNSCPLHLKEVSEIILRRCEGMPLAIVVIGGLLATKSNNIEEWKMFNRNIGDELGDNLSRLKKLISLSFYDLPYYLKSCFLYLSIFPEDELLQTVRLVQLWTAEGFVQEKQGKTVEEVAEGYLNELVNRGLVQVVDTLLDGRPSSFRIHDLFREYIISKSRHEIFFASDRRDVRWNDKIRRIALDASSNNIQDSYSFEHLRSVMWFGSEDLSCVEILTKVLAKRCRLLKVLDLRRAPLQSIPDEVFKLYHLKYLNLRGTKIEVIPKSIKNLINLETLDVSYTRVIKLPTEVVKLKKLRHLLVGSFKSGSDIFLFDPTQGFQGPNDIGRLSSLQILVYLNASEVDGVKTVVEIGKLTQLLTLGLTMLKREDGIDLCSSISKLTNLKVLYLCSIEGEVIDLEQPMSTFRFPSLQRLILHGRLEKIPHWAPSLIGLTSLNLIWSRLRDEDALESIHGLPNLLFLEMELAYEGEGLIFRTEGFQRLKRLDLIRLENLRQVKVEEGCMPHLELLHMHDCKMMVEVPEGLRYLFHLQYVSFSNMSEEFVNRAVDQKQRGKQWELGHVPKVSI